MNYFKEGDCIKLKRNWFERLHDKIFGYPWYLHFNVVTDGDGILWLKDRMGAWVMPLADINQKRYELL